MVELADWVIVWAWTILAALGIFYGISNVMNRTKDIAALELKGKNGPAIRAAQILRQSETIRLTQLVILLYIGGMYLAYFYLLPDVSQTFLVVLRWTIRVSFFSMVVLIVYNTWFSSRWTKRLAQEVEE